MFKHVLASYLERGLSRKRATQLAAATVNKYRAKLARGYVACRGRRCAYKRGPRLVTRGGSRRQWYPGKVRARARAMRRRRRSR